MNKFFIALAAFLVSAAAVSFVTFKYGTTEAVTEVAPTQGLSGLEKVARIAELKKGCEDLGGTFKVSASRYEKFEYMYCIVADVRTQLFAVKESK
jgi:hypothetical protein